MRLDGYTVICIQVCSGPPYSSEVRIRWRGEESPRQRILRPVEWVFLLVIAVVVGIDGREYWSGCQPMTTCLSV